MKSVTLFKTTLVTILATQFLACSENELPTAWQPVLDDSAIADLQANGMRVTLYQSVVAQGVPSTVAKLAFANFDKFRDQVRNDGFIHIVDFTQHSVNKRFYQVNRKTGKVSQFTVAHGEGSDPNDDGKAEYFSNVPDSHMSSLGSYLIQEKYISQKFGESLRLDGLEEQNSNVRDRAIVLHPSQYVKDGKRKQGRSWGCPAIPYAWIQTVIARASDGAFMFVHGKNLRSAAMDMRLLQKWQMIPKSLWPNESEDAPLYGE